MTTTIPDIIIWDKECQDKITEQLKSKEITPTQFFIAMQEHDKEYKIRLHNVLTTPKGINK